MAPSKEIVYICGHKNPDADSVCSSYALAYLKNSIDPDRQYKAIRCGAMNPQTKFIFEHFNAQAPELMLNIYPKVVDIVSSRDKEDILDHNEPLSKAINILSKEGIRMVPILENGSYLGHLGLLEVAGMFVSRSSDRYTRYTFRPENLSATLDGKMLKKGAEQEYSAGFVVGTMSLEISEDVMSRADPSHSVFITGDRYSLIQKAIDMNFCTIVITGRKDKSLELEELDLSKYKGWLFISSRQTEETIRKMILSVPVKDITVYDEFTISSDTTLPRAKALLEMQQVGLAVVDNGEFKNIVTKKSIYSHVANSLILIDHNEMIQAIDGAEDAKIEEIVDHHRLNFMKTNTPITVYARPLGSSCTLVYEIFRNNGVEIPPHVAQIMLAGILSDTVILKSPTTTAVDRLALEDLSTRLGIDINEFGSEIFNSGSILKGGDAYKIVTTDFKIYEESNIKFGVGQIELVNIVLLDPIKESIKNVLPKIRSDKNIDIVALLISDITTGDSILLLDSSVEMGNKLPYLWDEDAQCFLLPGVLSRKKQLLPTLLEVFSELAELG